MSEIERWKGLVGRKIIDAKHDDEEHPLLLIQFEDECIEIASGNPHLFPMLYAYSNTESKAISLLSLKGRTVLDVNVENNTGTVRLRLDDEKDVVISSEGTRAPVYIRQAQG